MFLRRRLAAAQAIRRRRRIPDSLLAARVRGFRHHLERLAPHWLAEADGMARGAGLPLDGLLMLNCLPPDFYSAPPVQCTSFVAASRSEIRLFKIRDERNHVQCFYIQPLPGGHVLQCAKDIGNLGVAHGFSSCGLAGANNTGSPVADASDEPRLNDCHVLRFLLERARAVDEIPELFSQLLERKAAGGAGAGRGAIYLFADPRRGLLLETQASGCVARFLGLGTTVVSNHFLSPIARRWMSQPPARNTRLRKKRLETLLARAGRWPDPASVFAASRDRANQPDALCNDDRVHFWMTLSAQLQVIPRDQPGQAVNYVCCGNTRHSVFLPVPLSFRESYLPLLNGRFYEQADTLYRAFGCRWKLRTVQREFERKALAGLDPRTAMEMAYRLLHEAAAGTALRSRAGARRTSAAGVRQATGRRA